MQSWKQVPTPHHSKLEQVSFYDQGLKSTGWDRYKSVDISNLNQVVGTRSGQESIQKATEKSNKNNSQNSPKKQ